MTISFAGYKSFRPRQLTDIPLTRIREAACDIAYGILMKDPDLLEKTKKEYAIRSPERQLEVDLKKGYEKVVP